MLTIIIATLAGAVTVAAPCTLPVLPILLGASVAQTSNVRPLFIALGFVTSFSVVAISFGTITQILGVDQNTLRAIAIPILLVFGLLMLWPTPFEWLVAHGRGLVDRSKITRQTPGGNVSGFLLGTTLGLVWTKVGRSCSSMPVRVSTKRLNERFKSSSTSTAEGIDRVRTSDDARKNRRK